MTDLSIAGILYEEDSLGVFLLVSILLGGGASSFLFAEVREKLGAVHGIGALGTARAHVRSPTTRHDR